MIKVSAPGKIHLLGEHIVVYGKPALLATVDLRVTVHLRGEGVRWNKAHPGGVANLAKIIEPIVKKELKIKRIPPYNIEISSQLPIGSGLGSSAAVSAAYIGALLSFLKIKWDLALVNKLTYEAEKVFHGNPSGVDNATVIFGGINVPSKLAKKIVLINTGTPEETTKEMVEIVSSKCKVQSAKFKKIFDDQAQLVRELLPVIQSSNEKEFIRIIRAGERNLESMGVVSPFAKEMIRKIEKAGGAAKICGAGGKAKATGVLLCYHPKPSIVENIAKEYRLDYFKTTLGVDGLKLNH